MNLEDLINHLADEFLSAGEISPPSVAASQIAQFEVYNRVRFSPSEARVAYDSAQDSFIDSMISNAMLYVPQGELDAHIAELESRRPLFGRIAHLTEVLSA
jgi:hypothetical protein